MSSRTGCARSIAHAYQWFSWGSRTVLFAGRRQVGKRGRGGGIKPHRRGRGTSIKCDIGSKGLGTQQPLLAAINSLYFFKVRTRAWALRQRWDASHATLVHGEREEKVSIVWVRD